MRIGIVEELSGEGNEVEVTKAISDAALVFTKLGAKVDSVKVPRARMHCPSITFLLQPKQAPTWLAMTASNTDYDEKESKDLLTMYYNSRQNGFGA